MLQGQDGILSLLSALRGSAEAVPDKCMVRTLSKMNRSNVVLEIFDQKSIQIDPKIKENLLTEALAVPQKADMKN